MMPKVSIIIPIYKVEAFLPDCLDSVLAQTFQDWEALCIDDGSPDNCGKILEKYAKKDERIRIITQKNKGLSLARNSGLKVACGKYLCFLDSDDALAPTFLEKMYHQIESTHSDVVSCDFQRTAFTGGFSPKRNSDPEVYENVLDCFLRKKPKIIASVWGKLFRKTIVEHILFHQVELGEDLIYLYEALYLAKKAVYLPEKLYFYRKRPNSLTTSAFSKKVIIGNIQAAVLWHEYFKDKKLSPQTRKLLDKRIARQIFKPSVLDPKRQDPKNLDKWYAFSKPLLRELKQEGIYQPKYLSLKNRFISFFFLKGDENA